MLKVCPVSKPTCTGLLNPLLSTRIRILFRFVNTFMCCKKMDKFGHGYFVYVCMYVCMCVYIYIYIYTFTYITCWKPSTKLFRQSLCLGIANTRSIHKKVINYENAEYRTHSTSAAGSSHRNRLLYPTSSRIWSKLENSFIFTSTSLADYIIRPF
jgi:hypothetical protein